MSKVFLPPFHESTPWWLKILCVLCVKLPHRTTFAVTFMDVLFPVFIFTVVFLSVYVPVLVWNKRQHTGFVCHFVYVLLALFSYANLSLVLVSVDVGVAAFVALLCSVHISYSVSLSLGKQGPQFSQSSFRATAGSYNLIPNQYFVSLVLHALCYVVLIISWVNLPRLNPDYGLLLLATFSPEVTGFILRVGYSLYNWDDTGLFMCSL